MILVSTNMFFGMGNRMGEILKPSDQQGCHIWYYRVARSSVYTQTSSPAVIPRVTERRSACCKICLFRVAPHLVQEEVKSPRLIVS